MAKLFRTKENQDKLAEVFKRITGKKWIPKIEDLPELDKIMREKPRSGRK